MKIEIHVQDGSKIVLEDKDFNAVEFAKQLNDTQKQVFTIGGTIFQRHSFQFILSEGTERIYPTREGQ